MKLTAINPDNPLHSLHVECSTADQLRWHAGEAKRRGMVVTYPPELMDAPEPPLVAPEGQPLAEAVEAGCGAWAWLWARFTGRAR